VGDELAVKAVSDDCGGEVKRELWSSEKKRSKEFVLLAVNT
jgi:hypothetical protein